MAISKIPFPLGLKSWGYITETILHYLDTDKYKDEDELQRIEYCKLHINNIFEMLIKQNICCISSSTTIHFHATAVIPVHHFRELKFFESISHYYPDSIFDYEAIYYERDGCQKEYLIKRYPRNQVSKLVDAFIQKNPFFKTFDISLTAFRHLREFCIKYPRIPIQNIDAVTLKIDAGRNGQVWALSETQVIKIDRFCNNILNISFLRQARALAAMLPHDNLNRFEGIGYVREYREWGFIFQRIHGVTFAKTQLASLSVIQKKQIALDLLDGAHHFERLRIRPNDLHLGNVMITAVDKRAIIIDYVEDMAREYDSEYERANFDLNKFLIPLLGKTIMPFIQKYQSLTNEKYRWDLFAADVRNMTFQE